MLKRRGGAQGDSGDLQLFLFDHLLLMVKQKEKHKHEMHKVYRRVRIHCSENKNDQCLTCTRCIASLSP